MKLYRLEHDTCLHNPTHGPCIIPDLCDATGDAPAFGWSGPEPVEDWPGRFPKPHEVCALGDEQVDTWFGFDWQEYGDSDYERMNDYAHCIPAGWHFMEYEVPEYHVYRLTAQCLFDPSYAISRQRADQEFIEKHKVRYES